LPKKSPAASSCSQEARLIERGWFLQLNAHLSAVTSMRLEKPYPRRENALGSTDPLVAAAVPAKRHREMPEPIVLRR
jgi:hypothetical protein